MTFCINRERDYQTIYLKALRAMYTVGNQSSRFVTIFCHMNHICDWKFAVF